MGTSEGSGTAAESRSPGRVYPTCSTTRNPGAGLPADLQRGGHQHEPGATALRGAKQRPGTERGSQCSGTSRAQASLQGPGARTSGGKAASRRAAQGKAVSPGLCAGVGLGGVRVQRSWWPRVWPSPRGTGESQWALQQGGGEGCGARGRQGQGHAPASEPVPWLPWPSGGGQGKGQAGLPPRPPQAARSLASALPAEHG